MDEVIELLKLMGATNILYNASSDGLSDANLVFEYNNKNVTLSGEWWITGCAGIRGSVKEYI